MAWVKVCGVRTPDIVEVAVGAGADAIGVVLATDSPRVVDAATARTLVAMAGIPAYLVTVDAEPDTVLGLVAATGAAGVQPHGRHSADTVIACVAHGLAVLAPVPVGDAGPVIPIDTIPEGAVPLFDTAGAAHGGSGVTFAWSAIAHVERRCVIAGGLGPTNVRAAIAATGAWGVDASSSLEREPGVKDPDTIRAFVREAKGA